MKALKEDNLEQGQQSFSQTRRSFREQTNHIAEAYPYLIAGGALVAGSAVGLGLGMALRRVFFSRGDYSSSYESSFDTGLNSGFSSEFGTEEGFNSGDRPMAGTSGTGRSSEGISDTVPNRSSVERPGYETPSTRGVER